MRSLATLLLVLPAVAYAAAPAPADKPAKPSPPVARKVPTQSTLHGVTRTDDYAWLREKDSPQVRAHLEAEDAYARAVLAPHGKLVDRLYGEILGRIQEDDASPPVRDGAYWHYARTERGKQHEIIARRKGALDAPEEIVLDVNALAEGKPYMSLGDLAYSPDDRLLAYTTDDSGFRDFTLRVRDLATGRDLPDTAERVASMAWAKDSRTLFYTTTDAAKRSYRLWRRTIGGKAAPTLVYEEKDERFSVGVTLSRNHAFVLVSIGSATTSEWRYLPAGKPALPLATLVPRVQDREVDVDVGRDAWWIRVNDTGRNFRLVKAPLAAPGEKHWVEVIPHRADVMLASVEAFADHLVVGERLDGQARLRWIDLGSGESRAFPVDEAIATLSPDANPEFAARTYRYGYDSLTTPSSILELDLASGQVTLLKRQPVLGGYDPAKYVSERLYATASDGTKIPISLVYRKGLKKHGKNPLLLAGYGAYGVPSDPYFSSSRVSLLDRGVVYAIAHVRGGGELGKPWHDGGRMAQKMNTFTDFIACAEALVAQKVTRASRLAITGGSAGGLLVGVVLNLRPDLFRAALVYVPFVDVLSTMLDTSLPLTVGEFEEWGNPQVKAEYDVMAQYSPYDNVKAQAYPAILVRSSFNDSQVMYWEPAKWVARLRATKTDRHPLLFRIHMVGGHGGLSGRYEQLRDLAWDYAFLLTQLGITK